MKCNLDEWCRIYEANLRRAIEHYREEYSFSLDELPQVVARMREAFRRGSFNKDGRAIKATCVHFGIAHTYKAIAEAIRGDMQSEIEEIRTDAQKLAALSAAKQTAT